jgi:hypothetical protein
MTEFIRGGVFMRTIGIETETHSRLTSMGRLTPIIEPTFRTPRSNFIVKLVFLSWLIGSSRFCVISLTYIGSLNLCVLCVFVVPFTRSPAGLYLRIHFAHQT